MKKWSWKKRIFIAICLSVCAIVVSCIAILISTYEKEKSAWVFVQEKEDGAKVYVNKNLKFLPEGNVRIEVKIDYSSGGDREKLIKEIEWRELWLSWNGFIDICMPMTIDSRKRHDVSYVIQIIEINCRKNEIVGIGSDYYTFDNEVVYRCSFPREITDWEKIKSGSTMEKVAGFVCKK